VSVPFELLAIGVSQAVIALGQVAGGNSFWIRSPSAANAGLMVRHLAARLEAAPFQIRPAAVSAGRRFPSI
jgi:hypothetical protein